MADQMVFDAVRTPMEKGISLIEASAGTGKTYAIAMLVLRAVVECGIKIDQVLVVTFTVGATDELRGRIRARLSEAEALLRGSEVDSDEVLRQWARGIGDTTQAEMRVREALLDIDLAAIHTIHGFCQKTLSEHALACGQLFDFEVTGDVTAVRTGLVHDFWREHIYPLNERYLRVVISCYDGPEALYQSIQGAEYPLARLVPEPFVRTRILEELDQALVELVSWWRLDGEALRSCLDQAVTDGFLKASLIKNVPTYWAELATCFRKNQAPHAASVAWLDEEHLLKELNGTRLRTAEKRRAFIADWPLPGACVRRYCAAVDNLLLALRLDLAVYLRTGISERLHKRAMLSFDDLIIGLATAVTGPDADDIRHRVASGYRIALIDEFQDTDDAQWRIFSHLFGYGAHYLFLIGDPKQAIYRFRGADIRSYLTARSRATVRLTLNRNFRSNPAVMVAINELFDGVAIAGITYQPVEPAKTTEQFRLTAGDEDCSGIIYCRLEQRSGREPRWSGGAAAEMIAAWVVAEAAALITSGSTSCIEKMDERGVRTKGPVKPADIAVLVRTNKQAESYQELFRRAGIPAVVSSRKAVYDTPEAADLLLVLQAVAAPGDARLLRTALSRDWFGLSGEEHFAICRDESRFNLLQQRFQGYLETWQELGVLPMAYRLLKDEDVFVHLCRRPHSERRIADISHLLELLQEAERQGSFTVARTLSHLQELATGKGVVAESELRLESDADALNIVTMHSAKGLEFPIVFCPYLLSVGYTGAHDQVVRCHDDNDVHIRDLGSVDFERHRARAVEEERQEEMRLAYVAVTRAQVRCYLFWADIKAWGTRPSSFESALGRVLFPEGPVDRDGQHARVQRLGTPLYGEYRVIPAELAVEAGYTAPATARTTMRARPHGTRSLHASRTRTSFSALALLTQAGSDGLPGAFDEDAREQAPIEYGGLPSGVGFGNIVHEVLERADFTALAREEWDRSEAVALCRRYHLDFDLEQLARLLHRCVVTPLVDESMPMARFRLADLNPVKIVKELEFSLHVDRTTTARINAILASEPTCRVLKHRHVEGYLNGFIDLICEYEGRYYVIDYKTNNLGDARRGYGEKSLQAAMQAHNYGLQYWLYTLVVHRRLQRLAPDYSYDRHFGGVLYLFVRGMRPEEPGSGVFRDIPDRRLLERLDHCFGGG